MKKLVISMVLLGVALATNGCIATVVTEHRFTTGRELVTVNDQVYVVDKSSGEVMKIDISSAGPFVADSESD